MALNEEQLKALAAMTGCHFTNTTPPAIMVTFENEEDVRRALAAFPDAPGGSLVRTVGQTTFHTNPDKPGVVQIGIHDRTIEIPLSDLRGFVGSLRRPAPVVDRRKDIWIYGTIIGVTALFMFLQFIT